MFQIKRFQAAALQVIKLLMIVSLLAYSASCATKPPKTSSNLCTVFKEKPRWYKAAKKSAARWGGPVHLPMAIMYQESSFKAKARPPMQYFLGFIPTGRASNAYGYSQALKSTWATYQRDIGSRFKDRDNFASAVDFIFWYMHKTYERNGVSKWDAYVHYLNYHEGQGGYSRGTHRSKQWLLNVARKVESRANQYSAQLAQCQAELDKMRTGWF